MEYKKMAVVNIYDLEDALTLQYGGCPDLRELLFSRHKNRDWVIFEFRHSYLPDCCSWMPEDEKIWNNILCTYLQDTMDDDVDDGIIITF